MNIIKSIEGITAIAPNSIVNADCLEAMKLIADKSIDAIIADLPFGITACHWDSVIPFDRLWEQYKRIIKPNGAIALFGSQPFTSALVMSNPKWFKYEWIWEKDMGTGFLNAKKQPLRITENISIFANGQSKYYPQMRKGFKPYICKQGSDSNNYGDYNRVETINNGDRYPVNSIKNIRNGDKQHPTQKPVALIEYLIKTYTQEGELILDNTAGSGTLAIAAINTNRQYICIEKDPHYFQVSCDRVANHDPNAPIKTKKPKPVPKGQLALF
jgi:site-specific DNA-methyltransferase (adenine-specific)